MFYFDSSQVNIFSRAVSVYAIIPVFGAVAAALAATLFAKQKKADAARVFTLSIVVFIAGAIMRLYQDKAPDFTVPFGVLLGTAGVSAVFGLFGKMKNDAVTYLQAAAVGLSVFLSSCKLGCFIVGCCHGNAYDGAFSVTYSENTFCETPDTPFFPIQLVTAFLLLLVAIIAFFALRKSNSRYSWLAVLAAFLTAYHGCALFVSKSASAMIINNVNIAVIISALSAAVMITTSALTIKEVKNEKKRL